MQKRQKETQNVAKSGKKETQKGEALEKSNRRQQDYAMLMGRQVLKSRDRALTAGNCKINSNPSD